MAKMSKSRLEAFSDGVLAIIITIMVLEIRAPHGHTLADLRPLVPGILSYVLSFIYVGIYWNNHHHLMHTVKNVKGDVLWANLHLLFWLSMVPFVTQWVGESNFAAMPLAVYGCVLLMAAVAYTILQLRIIRNDGQNSVLAKALGSDQKGKLSLLLYVCAVALCSVDAILPVILYVAVALIWLIPDRRIEKALADDEVTR